MPEGALTPKLVVQNYIAGGLTTAQGMPNLYALEALLSLTAAERLQWGKDVAAEFDAQLAPAAEAGGVLNVDTAGVEEIANIRPEAEAFLIECAQGFPYVGTWHYTANDTPVVYVPPVDAPAPKIAAVQPALVGDEVLVTVTHGTGFFHVIGEDLHAALVKAVEAVKWLASKL